MKRIIFLIDDETHEKLKSYLDKTGQSISGFFRVLLKEKLGGDENERND